MKGGEKKIVLFLSDRFTFPLSLIRKRWSKYFMTIFKPAKKPGSAKDKKQWFTDTIKISRNFWERKKVLATNNFWEKFPVFYRYQLSSISLSNIFIQSELFELKLIFLSMKWTNHLKVKRTTLKFKWLTLNRSTLHYFITVLKLLSSLKSV